MIAAVLFAILNRAAGSEFYGLIKSTVISRLIALGCMALFTCSGVYDFAYILAVLILWRTFGWGKYFACIHGTIHDEKEFALVDWIMSKLNLPTETIAQRKIWGLVAMTLRQSIIAPAAFGAWYLVPLMGLPYYIGGMISQRYAVMIAEFTIGAMIYFIIGG